MKKKIALMLTLILAAGTFKACITEEKSEYHFFITHGFNFRGCFYRRSAWHNQNSAYEIVCAIISTVRTVDSYRKRRIFCVTEVNFNGRYHSSSTEKIEVALFTDKKFSIRIMMRNKIRNWIYELTLLKIKRIYVGYSIQGKVICIFADNIHSFPFYFLESVHIF